MQILVLDRWNQGYQFVPRSMQRWAYIQEIPKISIHSSTTQSCQLYHEANGGHFEHLH